MSVETPLTTTEIINRRIEIDTHGSTDPFVEHDTLDTQIEAKSGENIPLIPIGSVALSEALRTPILGTEDQAINDHWTSSQK